MQYFYQCDQCGQAVSEERAFSRKYHDDVIFKNENKRDEYYQNSILCPGCFSNTYRENSDPNLKPFIVADQPKLLPTKYVNKKENTTKKRSSKKK